MFPNQLCVPQSIVLFGIWKNGRFLYSQNKRELLLLLLTVIFHQKADDNVQISLGRISRNVRVQDRLNCDSIMDGISKLQQFRVASIQRCLQQREDKVSSLVNVQQQGVKEREELSTLKAEVDCCCEVERPRKIHVSPR